MSRLQENGEELMAKHISAVIDSHIAIRGWSRLASLGDLIHILQAEYEEMSARLSSVHT